MKINTERNASTTAWLTDEGRKVAKFWKDDGSHTMQLHLFEAMNMTKDDARQLAAILLHFAETGELKGGEDDE